jgi:hypothetical protein
MANADAELQILISTAAELYGLDNAQAALAKYKNSIKESGEGAERHNEHHREMRRLFGELNKVLPESGHLLHGVFGGPQVLLIMAAVVAVSKFVEVIKEQKKHTEELLKLQTDVAVAIWTKTQTEAKAARDSVEQFNLSMAASARSYDTLKKKQEEAMAVLEIYDAALIKSAKGDEQRTERLQKEADGRKQLMLEAVVAQDAQAFNDAASRLGAAQGARAAGAPGADSAARAEASVAYNKAEFDKAQAAMNKIDLEKKARVSPELLTRFLGHDVTIGQIQSGEESFQERYKKVSDELAIAKNRYVADNAAIDAHKRALDALVTAEKEAQQELDKRTTALRQSKEAANQGFATLGAKYEAADEVAMNAAGLKTGSVAGRSVLRAIEVGEKFGRPGNVTTREDDQYIFNLIEALRAKGVKEQRIGEVIAELARADVSQEQKMKDVLTELKMLRSQSKSSIR